MTAPVLQLIGNQVAGTTAQSAAWPAGHQSGDLGILVIENNGNDTTITPPAGWAQVTGSPVVDVATTAGSKLNVWYKFATSSAEANVSTGDAGDHQVARIYVFRGVNLTNPFNASTTGTKTTASTTATWPSITTTAGETLVVFIASRPDDTNTNTDIFRNYSGGTLDAVPAELSASAEATTSSGTGGGFVLVTAAKTVAGATGTPSASMFNSANGALSVTNAYMVFALRPKSFNLIGDTQTYNETFNDANLKSARRINAQRLGAGIDAVSTTSVFSDDFNRANSTSLGSGWQLELNSFQISNNQVKGNTFDNTSIATVTASGYANNQYAQIEVAALNSSVSDYIGVGVRVTGLAGYYFSTDGYFQRRLSKKDSAGTTTAIGTKDIYWAVGDILKLSAEGNIISVYRNDQLVERVIDSSYTSGKPAISYNWFNTNAAAGDNFTSGNLVDNTNLLAQRRLVCDTVSYDLIERDATLVIQRRVVSDTASYDLIERDANLNRGIFLTANTCSYLLTRNDATLTYTQPGNAYTLTAEATSFSVTPSTVNLNRKVVTSAGTFTLTRNPATLTPSRYLSLARQIFTITGPPPSLIGIVDTHTVTINPPAGWALHLVTDISQAGSATCIYYNLSPAVAVGDQILYKTTTETNGRTVSVNSTGIVTTTPTGTDTLKFRHWRPSTWSAELTYTVVATSAYTLTLDTRAYTLTRNAANLNRGRTLSLTTSTYTLTGTATGLNRGRTLSLTTSTYTLTRNAANLNRGRTLSLTTSTYTLTGTATGLNRGRTLSLTTSAYTLTRNTANLLRANKLVLDTRTYSLTLNTASFVSSGRFGVITYSLSISANPVLFKRTVIATTSSYTLTRNAANLNKGRTLSLATQSYILSGNTLVPIRSIKLLADTRSYSLTRNDVAIKRTVILSLTVSTYTLTLNTANLRLGATLIANSSTFSITGNSLNLNKGRTLSLTTQSYTLTRNTANLLRGALLSINTRSYSLTRNDVALLRSIKLVADTRIYVLTRNDLTFARGTALPISTKSYSIIGNSAQLLHNNKLPITTQFYTLVRTSANLIHSSKMVINSSAYYLTGNNINFIRTEILEELPQDFHVTGNPANLLHSARITANTSSYSYSGNSISMFKSIPFGIDAASYNISTFSLNIVKVSTAQLNIQNYEITSSELNILVGRKILAEGARTNYILNSTMAGASAGSPGTFPTTWVPYFPTWATKQITSIGVDSTTGFNYIDVSISGTNNSGSLQSIQLDPISYNTTLANAGETWTSSAYFGLISGNWPASSVFLGTVVRNSLGQNIDTVYSTIKDVTGSGLQRVIATNSISDSSATYVQTVIRFEISNGDSLNLTIRIAAPQLERSLVATNFIPTINAPAYKWFETSYTQASFLATRLLTTTTRYYDTNTYVEPGYFEPNYTANSLAFIRARNFVIDTGTYVVTGYENIIGLEGLIKVWTGSSWSYRPLKVWNGTAWVQKPLKIWNGSIWRVY